MESKQVSTQEKRLSKTEKAKTLDEMSDSQGDSCISLNFDSAADCSYKSEEISATNIISKENLSSHNISDQQSKTEQHLTFDSGLEPDCPPPLNESAENLSEEFCKSFESPPPKLNKLQWRDIFSQDKDGDT